MDEQASKCHALCLNLATGYVAVKRLNRDLWNDMRLGKGFVILGGLFLLAAFLGNRGAQNPEASVTQTSRVTSTSAPPPANPLKMSIAQVEAAVEENEINLQNRIKAAGGILVSARVKSVEAIWGKPVIHFRGKNEFLDASAFLSSSDKERAASLKRGDTVLVLCQTAKKIMGAALYDCVLN